MRGGQFGPTHRYGAGARVIAKHEERAALVHRADQQHAWVLAGDDRGVYGDYRPQSFKVSREKDRFYCNG